MKQYVLCAATYLAMSCSQADTEAYRTLYVPIPTYTVLHSTVMIRNIRIAVGYGYSTVRLQHVAVAVHRLRFGTATVHVIFRLFEFRLKVLLT